MLGSDYLMRSYYYFSFILYSIYKTVSINITVLVLRNPSGYLSIVQKGISKTVTHYIHCIIFTIRVASGLTCHLFSLPVKFHHLIRGDGRTSSRGRITSIIFHFVHYLRVITVRGGISASLILEVRRDTNMAKPMTRIIWMVVFIFNLQKGRE